MNRRNALLLLIIVATGAVVSTAWFFVRPAPVFSLRAPASAAVGEEIVVALSLDSDAYTVTAGELTFMYDAQRLQLVSLTQGSLLPTVLVPVNLGSGRAAITLGSGIAATPGPGTLAVLTFKVTATGDATVTIDSSSRAAAAGSETNVLPQVNPVTVRVR